MRLIDSDKAKEVLRGLLYETAMNNIQYANVYEDLAKNRMDIWFNLIPTVDAVLTDFHDKCQQIEIQKRLKLEEELKDAEPVRHGHWDYIEEYFADRWWNTYQCSVCGHQEDFEEPYRMKYCPECGSKMDEVTE